MERNKEVGHLVYLQHRYIEMPQYERVQVLEYFVEDVEGDWSGSCGGQLDQLWKHVSREVKKAGYLDVNQDVGGMGWGKEEKEYDLSVVGLTI